MVCKETAQRWIEAANADERLKPLFEEIEKTYALNVSIIKGPEWESSVKGKDAIIRVAETTRPLPSFAHEALHLCLSARGYRHILGCGNHDPATRGIASALLGALDNELQHHRMFDAFVAAGFDGTDFYAESDDESHALMKPQIEALTDKDRPSTALFSYLTLIAPGGRWPEGAREELLTLLEVRVSPGTWKKLLEIKALIEQWKRHDSLDPTETIASIFETLGDLGGTFLAEDVGSYPNGVFVPRSLTQAQFEALRQR